MTATATAKATIDWNKPVQVSYCNGPWVSVRVLATDMTGDKPIVVGFVLEGILRVFAMPNLVQYGNWQFRNTPAPPVQFEFTRYVNVRRCDDGTFHDGGQVYPDADTAARGLGTKFVTVPVTIRGEWKEGESNG